MPRSKRADGRPVDLRPTRNSRDEKFLFAPRARLQRRRPDSGSGPPPTPRGFSDAFFQLRPWGRALVTDGGNVGWLGDEEVPRRRRRGKGGMEPPEGSPLSLQCRPVKTVALSDGQAYSPV